MIRISTNGYHGISLPDLDIGMDTSTQQQKYVFISHAHADHVPRNRYIRVIATPATAALMRARGFQGEIETLYFGQKLELPKANVQFFPAGHILGSAMTFVESEQGSVLYTGDCKTPASPASDGFSLPKTADQLITEATFSLPIYRWKPHHELEKMAQDFATKSLSENFTPVFLAYNLGKAQELMVALRPLGIPVMIHGAGFPLCEIYRDFGIDLGDFQRYDRNLVKGKILICPSSSLGQPMLNNIKRKKIAYVSGWAAHESVRQQMTIDARIPMSDHLDFFEVINLCEALQPKKVWVTHSPQPQVMCYYLQEKGFDAEPLAVIGAADE